jgi:asparagine synthase (glutamine-hydrolysing)
MCGFASIYSYATDAAPVSRRELDATSSAMQRRGPDGSGIWIADHGRTGLAHRRLAIIDISDAAAQPMQTADGRLRIVFNGEIYNYRELRASLEAKGHRFATTRTCEAASRSQGFPGKSSRCSSLP